MVFLDWRFLHSYTCQGGGLDLFTLSLRLPLKVALFFLLLLVMHTFPIETLIRNAAKGGKIDRKPYPYGFIYTIQSTNEEPQ
jgi:hypothetical protein